jgi:FlaA1/EpsC-like NDP-sugar epimerase
MTTKVFEGKNVLVTGGTGSLGKVLVKRLLSGKNGTPARVTVLSRDEAKQHDMRLNFQHRQAATDEVIYRNFSQLLQFRIGDVRSPEDVGVALQGVDVVVNAAALKQVPVCEYFTWQAVQTNCGGAANIVDAIQRWKLPIETVVGVSTDKACKPVNAMGMSKALQERIFIGANVHSPKTRFVCVRYGNVLASRGSVVPLFHEQIRTGGPVTITDDRMTRFLLTLEQAVDTIVAAIGTGLPGETLVPRAPAALMTDLAAVLIGDRKIETRVTGIRPGEKLHEIMVSDEESARTIERGNWYAIRPMLPELDAPGLPAPGVLTREYSSGDTVLTRDGLRELITRQRLRIEDVDAGAGAEELLR